MSTKSGADDKNDCAPGNLHQNSSSSSVEDPIHIDLAQVRKNIQAYVRQHQWAWLAQYFQPQLHSWVLVPNGSFMGYFDWVPLGLRVGPWNIFACLYLFVMAYGILLAVVYHWLSGMASSPSEEQQATSSCYYDYYPAFTMQWYYSCFGFAWTTMIAGQIAFQGSGVGAWGTYTVQTWTLIWARHGLAAIVPWVPSVAPLLEYLRLPMLAQATITFVTWNLILAPLIFVRMNTAAKKQAFVKVMTNFRLTQLHVVHIGFAALHGIWGTPSRTLTVEEDFIVTAVIALQYALFYFWILDRFGVHLYLIFSPRTKLALVTWTMAIASYGGCFLCWRYLIDRYGST